MPIARFEMPDGRVGRFEVPEGTTPEQAQSLIQQSLNQVPAAEKAGSMLNDIPRQLGLTARHAVEGLANTAQVVTEPIRYFTDRLTGQTGKTVPLGVLASQAADAIGLPKPADANERVIADATRLGFGTLTGAGIAQRAGGAASDALQFAGKNAPAVAQGAGQKLAQLLGSNPGAQVVSAVGAGAAGGASREAGGSALEQGVAALVGGVGGGLGAQAVQSLGQSAVTGIKNLIPAQRQLVQQRVDQRINIALQTQGIDPATITPAMRSAMREQVSRAMNTGGDLNPEAIARLADYTRLGMTPTRARLTLDPFDVTQEANASKLAAATGSRDARLPQIAQQNNQRLIGLIDEMGGARPVDTFGQGAAVTGAIRAQDEALARNVNDLYGRVRGMAGGDIPLDRKPFVDNIFSELARSGKTSFAPESVMGRINQISGGVVRVGGQDYPVPFTPQVIDELKTEIATALRGTTDGNVRAALSAIRRGLDATPVNLPPLGPGVVTGQQASVLRGATTQANDVLGAMNDARRAAAQRFSWQESARPIDAALGGAVPDTFIKNQIIGRATGFEDAARTAEVINANPAARDAVRTAIVQHLKDSSIGKGGTSQTGNFSGRGMEAAMKDIGDRKLGLFFEPSEVETLKAMARAGSFETFQPRGSAVNNSNTAAGVGSLLMGLADRVRPIANKIPLGEMVVSGPLDNIAVWAMQRPVQNIPRGLLAAQPAPPVGAGLLLPGAAATGGLLLAP